MTTYNGGTPDGYIAGADADYATARTTAAQLDNVSQYEPVGQQLFLGSTHLVYREFLEFDTSAISDTDVVTSVQMHVAIYGDGSDTDFDVLIYKCAWDSPLGTANMEANYDAALAGTLDATWQNTNGLSTDTYYASGSLDTSWVNKAGITRYALLSSRDVGGTAPTGSEYLNLYSADDETYPPYLAITSLSQTTLVVANVDHAWAHGAVVLSAVRPVYYPGINGYYYTGAALAGDVAAPQYEPTVLTAAAAPTTGTARRGDICWNSEPSAGGPMGWMCTHSGTFSDATDSTGDTDGSTEVIIGMTDTSDFSVGDYVDASAGFPGTGPFRVMDIAAGTIYLDTYSTSAQSNVTVSTSDPVWTAMANLAG